MLTIIGDIGYDVTTSKGEKSSTIGGSGYHTMIGSLCSHCTTPRFLTSVGYDFNIYDLIQYGIPIEYVIVRKDIKTTSFYIDYFNDERSIRIEMGASGLDCCDIIDDKVLESNYIHLPATDPSKQMRYISHLRNMGYKGKISADVLDKFCLKKENETRQLLDKCDIIFMNRDERRILEYKPIKEEVLYVFKQDKDGAELYYAGKHIVKNNLYSNKTIVDTTGAGDILAGAFLGFLDVGINYEEALEKAVHIANSSVYDFGSEHTLLLWGIR